MDHQRYQHLMEIIDQVIDRPDSREQILAEACNDDESLRYEVEKLLAHQTGAADFLEESPLQAIAGVDPVIGKHFGPYRLIEQIGHGGMGTVYKAVRDDQEYKTEVAIKLIKRGMDTDYILRRFRNERQILANLNHPNIARMLDGGTTDDGRPYFVMEYIEGQAIDKYCDEKRLPTSERLGLFRTVCSAVQHAHQRLVVHRDLKPHNILITPDGTPKLLDFGIAKLLDTEQSDPATALTALELRAMTPEYASPEQVRGEAVTTSSDVYSLAVVLYELLTGHRPYRFGTRRSEDVARVICEQEPERPSTAIGYVEEVVTTDGNGAKETITPESVSEVRDGTPERLKRRLQGDLDNIVLMALRKEPERRYASAEHFSEDIRRHLEGLPVSAHKDTYGYRTLKFVRRHRAAVIVVAVIILLLVGGVVATTWQARVARAERARADQRFNDVRKLANSFMFEFYEEIDKGPTKAKELVVKRALEYLDSLSQEASTDVSLKRELATAYDRIGRIQGNSYYSNLGNTDGALKSYRKSLEIRQRLATAYPDNREIQKELAESHHGLGDVLYSLDDLQAANQAYEASSVILEKLIAAEPDNLNYQSHLGHLLINLGDLKGFEGFSNLGDTAGAIKSYQRSREILEQLLVREPENRSFRVNLANALGRACVVLGTAGDIPAAIERGRKGVALWEQIVAANPHHLGYRMQLLANRGYLDPVLINDDRTAEAIENRRQIIKTLEETLAADPQNTYARRSLGVSYRHLGTQLLLTGDLKNAKDNLDRALETARALSKGSPGESRNDLSIALSRLAEFQFASKNFKGALENYKSALDILNASPTNSATQSGREELSFCYIGLGRTWAELGDYSEAINSIEKGLALAEENSAKSATNMNMRNRLAQRYFEFGKVRILVAQASRGDSARDHWQQARVNLERSVAIWNEMRSAGKLPKAANSRPHDAEREIAKIDQVVKP